MIPAEGQHLQAKMLFSCSSAHCYVLQSLQINKNRSQDDEDRFEDLSDPSDDDTDNEEIATGDSEMESSVSSDMTQAPDFAESDSDMMDVDSPVMPQSLGLLQTHAASSNAYVNLMDVDI
ncbi:hypothetical protein K435DRAFT_858026 [Dendrothele bispora CBS 962.96]|uniref:Uncharacterized protein n=1 Tax=Dendrothele bispora (strain CBS 962.96) TaxID=1314807 RepID=A0A4S8M441_DENBC|nr:hypothetical protein K435DRAFT_858026 [Dendrothele bispora CBS 962.96]